MSCIVFRLVCASRQNVISSACPSSSATGPTLWHFENDRDASSLELPLEDVKAVARKVGFEISVRFSATLPSHFFSLCLPERLSDLAPLVAG